jgi:hypothetical protein
LGLVLYALPNGTEIRLLSVLRVLDYPSGAGVLRFLNDDPSRLQRATGTSVDPNSFGGMLAVVAALTLPQLLLKPPVLRRRWLVIALGAIVLALMATVSRGSMLGLAAAIVVVGLVKDRRLLGAAVGAGALVVLAAGVLPWTANYLEHLMQGLALQDRASQMRVGEYTDAVTLISRYPVLGVGFGGVRDIDLYRGVSSLYLIIAESMGLVGLSAFAAVMAAFLGGVALAWRGLASEESKAIALGAAAAVVAALVSGAFDHYFFSYPHAFALLWLVVALGVCATQVDAAERRAKQDRFTF